LGKLVLYFPDGSTRDVLLTKERTTIGRRPDNDVPLPSAAVSAEHAAVVTVLDDSFLEDLGSTNGTFVNDRPVTKHFLRDHDRLDVGREIMVYYTDDDATPEALPPEVFRHDTGNVLAPLDAHLAALETLTRGRGRKGGGDSTAPRPVVAEFDPKSIGPMTGQVATEFDALAPAEGDPETTQRVRAREVDARAPEAMAAGASEAKSGGDVAEATDPTTGLVVRVLDGPNAGRQVVLKAETLLGRIGLEVVALRWQGGVVRLHRIEGPGIDPHGNAGVATEGQVVRPGESFCVAGASLLLAAQ